MKKWLFALAAAATVGAIAANLPGFIMGGPRESWELVATLVYLLCWEFFFHKGSYICWQRQVSRIWWVAAAVCCVACFCVVTFDLDGFLLMFPALGLVTPLSGLAVCTGTNYSAFYGFCTILAVRYILVNKYDPVRDP